MIYLKYLIYVLRHKWFVFLACYEYGIVWRGIIHDNSKFLPSEFVPYAKHFYGKGKRGITEGKYKTGYYKPSETGDLAFERAWFWHQKRNAHHWQFWVVPDKKDNADDNKAMSMSDADVKEMVCDWIGAGRAQGNYKGGKLEWYSKNKHRMKLHPDTENKLVIFLAENRLI